MATQDLPTLYYFESSFYSQKVRLYLAEKNVKYQSYIVDTSRYETYQPFFMKLNPTGQVPLLTDGATVVPDSNDIINYVENKYDHLKAMLPRDEDSLKKCSELWALLDRVRISDLTYGGMLNSHLTKNCRIPSLIRKFAIKSTVSADRSNLFKKLIEKYPEHREMYEKKFHEWKAHEQDFCTERRVVEEMQNTERIMDEIEQQLASMEEEFSGTDHWLVGRDFCVADVVLAVTLNRLDMVGFSHRLWGDAASRPRIAEYFSRLQDRKAFQDVCKLNFWKAGWPMIKRALPWKTIYLVGTLAVLFGVYQAYKNN